MINTQSHYPKSYKTYYHSYTTSHTINHIYHPVYISSSYRSYYYYYPDYYYYPYYPHGYYGYYYYNPYGIYYYRPYYYGNSNTDVNFNEHNYYYTRPNYVDYYRNSNLVSTNYYNSFNLASEYDPTDWMPNLDPFFDAFSYIRCLTPEKIMKIKIKVRCSSIFCILIVNNFEEDNLKYDKNKNRIYVDVLMRNYQFINTEENNTKNHIDKNKFDNIMTKSKKICLIKSFLDLGNNIHKNFNSEYEKVKEG